MGLMRAERIVCGYGAADEILKGVELIVETSEMVAVIGPNGAGKSTLLKAIAGLLPLKSGAILFGGEAVQSLSPGDRARRGIAFVPQEANVFPSMTVRENLEMGGLIEHAGIRARIDALLERFPVWARTAVLCATGALAGALGAARKVPVACWA